MWLQTEKYWPNLAQWKVYASFWFTFTTLTGWYVAEILDVIYVEVITAWDGIWHASVFSFFCLLMFHVTWVFSHQRWPIPHTKNAFKHGFSQLFMQSFGFIGSMLGVVAISIYLGDVPNSAEHAQKQFAEIAIIMLVCIAAILVVTGVFYMSYITARNADAQQVMVQSELKALRAQINPHFLFNSMNSILALIKTQPEKAERVLENLAEIFRYSLRSDEKGMVSLAEELEQANMYLDIEIARFGDRIQLEIDVDEDTMRLSVPPMILQPLVENSVKHVVNKIPGNHTIRISAHQKENVVKISVQDSGGGFPPLFSPQANNGSTGLYNVKRKIELSTAGNGRVHFDESGVHLLIPTNGDH